jgi:hypothetical protein
MGDLVVILLLSFGSLILGIISAIILKHLYNKKDRK